MTGWRRPWVALVLVGLLSLAAGFEVQAATIRLLDNNRVPQKILVILTGSTLQFCRDLCRTVKIINSGPQVAPADRIKVHLVCSSRDLVKQLNLSAEDQEQLIEVNDKFTTSDIWAQDMGELCASLEDGKLLPAVFDSRRGRGLGPLPRILAEMWGHRLFTNPTSAGDHGDYGGNIEVTPDNVLFAGNTMTGPCAEYFKNNGYEGRMILLDTRWLSVGHIDETMMVIPTAHAPGGYSIVRADPDYALELLAAATDEELNQIPSSYQRDFLRRVRTALRTAETDPDAIRGSQEDEFIKLNRAIGEIIESNVGKFKQFVRQVTGDENRDFAEVPWPNLYQGRLSGSRPSGCSAYLPGVVNLTVLRNHLLVPACHFPPFDRIIEARFRAQGNTVHFIDDQPYHTSMGEIHCGTNVLRDPNRIFVSKRDVERMQKIKATFRALHGS